VTPTWFCSQDLPSRLPPNNCARMFLSILPSRLSPRHFPTKERWLATGLAHKKKCGWGHMFSQIDYFLNNFFSPDLSIDFRTGNVKMLFLSKIFFMNKFVCLVVSIDLRVGTNIFFFIYFFFIVSTIFLDEKHFPPLISIDYRGGNAKSFVFVKNLL